MGYEQIVSLVSTVAFPIAMCLLMCFYITRLQEQHRTESEKLNDSLNEVKLVLEQLKTILERRGQ